MPDVIILTNLLTKFAWLGNWLFFILAFIESAPFVGLFIPGATLISVGGFLAYQGYLNTWNIILFSFIGAVLGDFFSYSLGRWGGNWIKNKKIINYSILKHGEFFFNKYGNKSIFWGRFFGPVRAIIPLIAGLARMKQRPFIFWNILSGLGWSILNVFLGYFSGTLLVFIFKKWTARLSIVLIIISTIIIVYIIIKKRNHSISSSFRFSSLFFVEKLKNYTWFKKLNIRYPIITEYFKESKNAAEKLFGGLLITSFLIFIYILTIILDII